MVDTRPIILVVTSTFPRWPNDTLPNFVYQLCIRLSNKYNIHVLAPHTKGSLKFEILEGIYIHRFRYAPNFMETLAYGDGIIHGLKHHPWRVALIPFFMLSQWLNIRNLHKKYNFSILHAHWIIPQGLITTFSFSRRHLPPIVCTSHGSDLFHLNNVVFRKLQRAVISRSRAITVVSNALKEKAIRLTNYPEKLFVLPMGIDLTNQFIPSKNNREKRTALFVGRLVEQKGLKQLFKAWALVVRSYPDALLTIIGDGPDRKLLEEEARKNEWDNNVAFIGPVKNELLNRYYQLSSLTVFPSMDSEGLGLVLVEALGCGCTVIASDLPGVRDVIIDDTTGILTPPNDAASLAKNIIKIFDSPVLAAKLGKNGRTHVMKNFNWDTIANNHCSLFDEILAK